MKIPTCLIVIMLFLSPVFLADYSPVSVSSVDSIDRAVTAESTGEDWLSGWNYRKSLLVHGSIGAGTDYQIRVTVHFGSGTDGGYDVYCDSYVNTDFGDIRFTDDDGLSELDYWLEEYYVSDNATFWVEVSNNLDTDQMIFIYFGNTLAETTSDGENTFLFFDDFEGSVLDLTKWFIEYPDGTATIADSTLTLVGNDGDFRIALRSLASAFKPASIRFRGMLEATQTTPQWNHIAWSHMIWGPGTYQRAGIRSKYGVDQTYVANDNGVIGDVSLSSQYFDTFHTFDVHRLNDSCELYSDDSFVTSGNNQPDDTSVPIILYCRDDDYTLQCDWIFMRKMIDTEPTLDEWGVLEFEPSDGLSWFSNWEFRKSHIIGGSPGAGYDYQVKIVVYFGVGIDSGNEVYCNSYCRSDFGDVFFTDNDGITELSYWMEEMYDSENATFWVKLQDNLDNDQSIYVYYGNPDQMSVSDGFSTFIFFDDFESDTLGADPNSERWWLEAAQDPDDFVRIALDPIDSSNQVLCAAETGDTIANVAFTNNFSYSGPVAIGHKFRYDLDYKGYFAIKNQTNNWVVIDQLDYPGVNDHNWFIDQDYYQYSPSIYTTTDEWFNWEYRCSPVGMTLLDRNTGQIHTGGYVYVDYSDPYFASARYGLRHGANTWWTDDMYVRKFVSSEPAHGTWGVLESAMTIDSSDLSYEAGTTGHSAEWTTFSYHPYKYYRFVDDALLVNSSWDGSDFEISADGLDPGSHNFTIQIFNTLGYSLSNSVMVNVEDTTDPTLSHPDDVVYTESTPGNSIEWTMNDLYPSSYELHVESELVFSGTWNTTGETLIITVDGLPAGLYNFSLTAVDESGNSATDYVTVNVQPNFTVIILMVGVAGVVLIIGIVSCRVKKT
ncbi:MAG: DUF2341 domain-containing protein [Candidatus Thorarchaeota archaeon]